MKLISQLLIAILSILTLIFPNASFANCYSNGTSDQDLGAFPSTSIQTQTIDLTLSSSFQCDPPLVGLITSNEIDATLIQSAFVLASSNGDTIPYQLFTDANRRDAYTIGETKSYGPFTDLITLLGLFSSTDGAIPLYMTIGTSNPSPGFYSDTIIVQWDWKYCSGIGITPLICLGYDTGSEAIAITISLTVTGDCGLSVNSVDLGQITYLGNPHQTAMNVSIRCSKDLSYQVYVDGGNNFNSENRSMNSSGELIPYIITEPVTQTSIGPTIVNSYTGVGSGSVQLVDFMVSTIVENRFPAPGSYQDTVRVIAVY